MVNEVLFHKAKKGDTQAFSDFIKDYERLIYNVVYRMLPNSSDAEDISQEVLIKVYKSLSSCKSPEAFKSWLYRIINNACIDEIRRRKGKITYSLDNELEGDSGPMENQILKDENTPESEFFKKTKNQEIQKAINNLPENAKTMIILRDVNGLSYEEIAEITKLNPGTVKSRIARARSNFIKEYKKITEQK